MSIKSYINNISDKEFTNIVSTCKTKVELHSKLGVPVNGTFTKLVNERILLTEAKLNPIGVRKYPLITKTCPVCSGLFEASQGSPKEKQTCSYACSNTYFRSGKNNGMYGKYTNVGSKMSKHYRTVCFTHHKKECIICGESNIVTVHHYNGNHTNNNPSNLIPLCPTHHQYVHSNFYYLIKDKVEAYKQEQSTDN